MGYIEEKLIDRKYLETEPGFFMCKHLLGKLHKDAAGAYKELLNISDLEFVSDGALFNSDLMKVQPYEYSFGYYDLEPANQVVIQAELFNTNLLKRVQQIEAVMFLFEKNIGTSMLQPSELNKMSEILQQILENISNLESISYGKNIHKPLEYFNTSRKNARRCMEKYLDNISRYEIKK